MSVTTVDMDKNNVGSKRAIASFFFVQLCTDEGIIQELRCVKKMAKMMSLWWNAGMGVGAAMEVGRVEQHRYVVLRAFEGVQPNRLNSLGW